MRPKYSAKNVSVPSYCVRMASFLPVGKSPKNATGGGRVPACHQFRAPGASTQTASPRTGVASPGVYRT